MSKLIQMLKSYDDYAELGGVPEIDIVEAEKKLNVDFAPEYKEYLLQCGTASVNGHELTGICISPRLNVITVTEEELQIINMEKAYVIERIHMDRIVIWQRTDGEIYKTQGKCVTKLCDSLAEYVTL